MPTDPYPGYPSPNVLADAAKIRAQLDVLFGDGGKSIITTEETRTNTAYGLMTTPDRVSGVVLPTNGLLAVGYQAVWKKNDVGSTIQAAIYLGANQVQTSAAAGAPTVQAALYSDVGTNYGPLATDAAGLSGVGSTGTDATQVTTGQILGSTGGSGLCYIWAAAGTYDVSVQFKASAGGVIAKNRKLWCWTVDP